MKTIILTDVKMMVLRRFQPLYLQSKVTAV